MNKKNDIIKSLSNKLFTLFYVDDKKYGIQQADGTYKLLKKTITPATIDDMLKNQKSLLTYQELHILNNAFIKWVCIDIDIIKKEIENYEVNQENLSNVHQTTKEICLYLESLKIPYILEFSGRRGFHIWIIFEGFITKENGFKLVEYIYENTISKFKDNITADKYPKTAFVPIKSKGIGLGVKLPLSQNKGSGKLSFFLNNIKDFDFDENNWLAEPNEDFLVQQYEIISKYKPISEFEIKTCIKAYDDSHPQISKFFHPKRKEVNSFLPEGVNLDTIIPSLRKCIFINPILNEYERGLSRKDRSILVGLLIQLKTQNDNDFGYNLLLELFSRVQGFDEKKTKNNIEYLKYYQPISCKILGNCDLHSKCKVKSPIELIEGVELIESPFFSIKNITETIFKRIIIAIEYYIFRNDEVPLFPLIEKNKIASYNNIKESIEEIFTNGIVKELHSFEFKRQEENKLRTLFSIDSVNNITSIYSIYILNSLFYSELSNNSYGYRLVSNFNNGNIFQNWFVNWIKYTNKIEDVLFGEEYQKYHVIKIDIKSYYDSIDLLRLKLKLFEESSTNIKARLKELSDEDLTKYKNIIEYLISLTKSITKNNNIGLPQGPAYARYLAEIYLTGLDNLIENYILINQKREFYYRFVDDIFIFTENEERAIELLSKISDWLAINGLELNTEKTKIENVEIYAKSGDYKKYKDDIKYDINKVNKNKAILSETEIQEALLKLEQLTDSSKFGLKDNLRFFYYNFKNDKRIDFIRNKLSYKLPFTIDGRGTLYFLFYKDLIQNYNERFWALAGEISQVKGLSLTHFLNTILLYYDDNVFYLNKIEDIVSHCQTREDLSEADILLVSIIALRYNITIKKNYSMGIMNFALETPGIKYTSESWGHFDKKFQNLDSNELFLKEIERIIKENEYTLEFLEEFSKYSFTRFSEWESKGELSFIKDEKTLLLYYYCLCFLTLFEKSKTIDNIKFSWNILTRKSDLLSSYYKIDNYWIDKVKHFTIGELSFQSYNFILIGKVGSELPNNELIEKYKDVLITFLFALEKEKKIDLSLSKSSLLNYIDKDTLFYKWVNDITACLYPEKKDICMRNIALNGIIVLKKNDSLFIKYIGKEPDSIKYNYLTLNPSSSNNEFEYEFKFEILDDSLKSDNFPDAISRLAEIIIKHESFIEKFHAKPPYFYEPFLSYDSNPLIPFYSDFDKIVTNDCKIQENTIEIYWENLMFILSKLTGADTCKIIKEENRFDFNLGAIEDRFIPKSNLLINKAEDKINFVKVFAEIIKDQSIKSIFQFQYYWSKTIVEIISTSKYKKHNNLFINYLKIHFDHFPSPEKSETDILFSINDAIDLNCDNLSFFYNTIKKSFEVFQSEVELSDDFNFLFNVFEQPQLKHQITDSKELLLSDERFKRSNISITKKWNTNLKVYEYELKIDAHAYEFISIYLFNYFKNEFEKVTYVEIEIRIKKDFVFAYINEECELFIFIPEDEIANCYRRICERDEIYKSAKRQNDPSILSLFPINKNYLQAQKTYKESERLVIEKKLKTHYGNSTINIESRIINWLTIFNSESIKGSELQKYMDKKNLDIVFLHKTILEVLKRHVFFTDDSIEKFRTLITKYQNDNSYFLFPIKNPQDDNNGLLRLIQTFDKGGRLFNFKDRIVRTLYSNNCVKEKDSLVIISDNFISGKQTEKALKYYISEEYIDNNRLLEINSEKRNSRYFTFQNIEQSKHFRANFDTFKNIIFLSAISTKAFKEKMNCFFSTDLKHKANLVFESELCFEDKDILLGKANINGNMFELFIALISDIDLIDRLFIFKNGDAKKHYREEYCDSDDYKTGNLILRIGSLPAKHIAIFTLKPHKGKPLLDYIENWK